METESPFGEFSLPVRAAKPRETGLTMVLDTGLSPAALDDMLSSAGQYIDYVKLGWATGLVQPDVLDKIAVLKNAGIGRCVGGTFFELAYLQGRVPQLFDRLEALEFDHLEISDGTIDLAQDEKLAYIESAASRFVVLSEHGSKDAAQIKAPRLWVEGMIHELEAGAWKVIAEGRESGTAGLYRGSSEIRGGLVDELVADIDPARIVWEAPLKSHQTFLIKQLGSDVNLGNIPPSQVIALETLRLGLRSDTLLHFHDEAQR